MRPWRPLAGCDRGRKSSRRGCCRGHGGAGAASGENWKEFVDLAPCACASDHETVPTGYGRVPSYATFHKPLDDMLGGGSDGAV
jgi:hypothetical protein